MAEQMGDGVEAAPEDPNERNERLNARYREEGWGLMTDQAFEGKLAPVDVESQARTVARWAYGEIKGHVDAFNRQSNQLVEQDAQISDLQTVAGAHARLLPKYHGVRAALALQRIETRRAQLEAARAQAEGAGYRVKMAEAELIFAEAASRRGDYSMPTSVEARPLRDWLDEHKGEPE